MVVYFEYCAYVQCMEPLTVQKGARMTELSQTRSRNEFAYSGA